MDDYLQSGNIEDPGVDSLKHWTILCYVSPRTISRVWIVILILDI